MRDTPVVLMGYLNPIEIHGAARFARKPSRAGVDGVLLVDLPPEELGEFADGVPAADWRRSCWPRRPRPTRASRSCATRRKVISTTSASPASPARDRLDTGAAGDRLRVIRARSPVPVVAGFGIKDAASAASMAREADGVVVGSALVAALASAEDWPMPRRAAARVPAAAACRAGWGRVGPAVDFTPV